MGLKKEMTEDIPALNLQVWHLIAIFVAVSIVVVLLLLWCYTFSRKKSKRVNGRLPVSQKPTVVSAEIKDIRVDQNSANTFIGQDANSHTLWDKFSDKDKDSDKLLTRPSVDKNKLGDNSSQSGSFNHLDKEDVGPDSGEKGTSDIYRSSSHPMTGTSPLSGLPEFSHLGWGHWFTLRDLEVATNRFSKDNVVGEGGYGVVYRGHLVNGSPVAVKKILNNVGQAEKEFRVEVEAIGHVRHKNLVRLLGYCIEGTHRLSYLHEAIEPKVVHRDIKSSNILLDDEFNAKLSDFGLAKLLGAGKSHITTRVMGTFGFGVLLLEAITGRDPVDYGRPADEVNLVDWLKMMVGNRRSEEVVDPNIGSRPSRTALKRALLTALRCVDPDSEKRLTMGEVVRMLESEEYPLTREGRRRRRSQANATEPDSQTENSDAEKGTK
ncbi:EF-Hand 1, calcium-binding site-containing protein [Cynara cardunculus var. scolymus]|uniref:non-specific serine/threonine protein kinase n=1 Tax=Cynara cardunculus var. scolymus TaxID=59895 RepID=A0A118JXT7_CYNCS|nr:EF-Hand 1, calcium-binding site-containing protein [Cynara cardunculus var. scolymus]